VDLLELHDFICDDLEWNIADFCSFFVADAEWNRVQEYTLVDMNDEGEGFVALPMRGNMLGQTVGKLHDRLIFMFDIFAERALFMEIVHTCEPQDDISYPRVTLSEGSAPHQLNAESLMDEESPFSEAMDEYAYLSGEEGEELDADEF
jgi:hypothetical protein